MGVLNVTPDSFYDGGRYNYPKDALINASKMVDEGAAIIDVGGESTRPGATSITIQEELDRVIPIIEIISQNIDAWISVDTSKPEVMLESVKAGAHLINDVYSLSKPGSLQIASRTGVPICLVHMLGNPSTMQDNPCYNNVIDEVDRYFTRVIRECELAGIRKENLIIDPGFGFGKTTRHNYELLKNLNNFNHFGLPILVGISRKSMVRQILHSPNTSCLIGSLACAIIAAMKGTNFVRVHDVKETAEALRIVEAVKMQGDNTI
jgi:dihydropteroate synthase